MWQFVLFLASNFMSHCLLFSYLEYEVDGVTYMRMKFHVSGSKRKGETVLELKKVSNTLLHNDMMSGTCLSYMYWCRHYQELMKKCGTFAWTPNSIL